jgi:DNA-directed RNA polymerase subunit E'/Rpb7
MIITKTIETGINLEDAIGMNANQSENIKNILIRQYEGKCFRGCLIKKFKRIREISDCPINQDGISCFGIINVIFEVTAIEYARGEIINGCVVNNNQKNGLIVCSTDNASIILSAGKQLESIQKDQKISIRVTKAKYNIGAKKIAVSAVPYLFSKHVYVYKAPADSNIDNDVKEYLALMLQNIKEEQSLAEKIKTAGKSWEFFEKLLYAYGEDQKTPAGVIMKTIDELLSGKGSVGDKYIYRDARINPATPNVYISNEYPSEINVNMLVEGLSLRDILLTLCDDYFNHLRTIREMTEIYNTEKLLTDHKNLWLIFKKAKLV